MTLRLDQLSLPVEIGQFYLVPTVTGFWQASLRNWPVIGPRHNDVQCLDFPWQHYHLDPRFLRNRSRDANFWRSVAAAPLAIGNVDAGGLPAPVWRRRKCQRLHNPRLDDPRSLTLSLSKWRCHFDQWTGKQARHDGRGWVCRHRSVSLADHVAIDGVITCPLHLLRIDAVSGVVLPPQAVPA